MRLRSLSILSQSTLDIGLEALEGKELDYGELSRQSLASNVEFVRKRNSILVQDFNITIRNAIGHHSAFIRLSAATVEFRDKKQIVNIAFRDLAERCKLLLASTAALVLTPVIFMHKRWDNIWQRNNSENVPS